MRRRATIGSTFALLAAALSACASLDIVAETGPADATVDTPRPPSQTLTFVIDRLEIDPTDDPTVPHAGFDLDHFFSTDVDPMGCTRDDYYSLFDIDQHCASVVNERCIADANPGCAQGEPGCRGGVDNQLPTLANTIETAANSDVRATIADRIANHQLVLVLRITNIDSRADDDAVRVALYGAFPRFADGCDRVDGGREYSVDRTSLVDGGTDIDADARYSIEASIVGGRLRTRGGPLAAPVVLQLPLAGELLFLSLHAFTLRADIAAASLERGALGGWLPGEDLLRSLSVSVRPENYPIVRGVVGGLVDIQVDGICDGSSMNPARYGGISVGLGMHAVPAVISESIPIADAASPGTCGRPLDDAGRGG